MQIEQTPAAPPPPDTTTKCVLDWTDVRESAGNPPRPRMSHAVIAVDNTMLFLFGESGKDNDRTFFNNISAFDTTTRTWTHPYNPLGAEGLDLTRGDTALLFRGENIVLFGGRNREKYFNDVVVARYDNVPSHLRVEAAAHGDTPDSERMNTFVTPQCQGAIPIARRGHCAANINDEKMFVFGGQTTTGELYSDTYLLDMGTMTWLRVDPSRPAPPPRVFQGCLIDPSGCILIHGGRGSSVVYDDMWIFDPRAEQWMVLEAVGPHPGPRLGHSLLLFGDQGSNILMWGGCTETYDYCNMGYCFDGRNNTWSVAEMSGNVPCPRSFHTATLVGRDMWVYGGWAGYRTCTGLWKASVAGQQVPKASLSGDVSAAPVGDSAIPATGDVTSLSYSVPRQAGASPYYRRGDHIPVTAVRLYTSKETQLVTPSREMFPEAFGRLSTASTMSAQQPATAKRPDAVAEEAWLDGMISRLLTDYDAYTPTVPELERFLLLARDTIAVEPSLVSVDPPVKIFGDIHGQMSDLIKFFTMCGNPTTDLSNYVFLGDYVDRGPNSLALRGNHEIRSVNHDHGFRDECLTRYGVEQGSRVWLMFNEVFDVLPPTALVARTVFCLHGGLCPQLTELKNAYSIQRPTPVDPEVPADRLLYNLLWSDPSEQEDDPRKYKDNARGGGVQFNRTVVDEFCQKNSIKLIVRGHERKLANASSHNNTIQSNPIRSLRASSPTQAATEGFFYFAGGKLLTVFSATNYCGDQNNNGAMLYLDHNLTSTLEVIKPDPVPHGHHRRATPPRPIASGRLLPTVDMSPTPAPTPKPAAKPKPVHTARPHSQTPSHGTALLGPPLQPDRSFRTGFTSLSLFTVVLGLGGRCQTGPVFSFGRKPQ
ncbi:putative Serine/threonine-protein phosphatase PP1 isozyme 9 [Paratrimastix pyriformis]|uniref:Serine/threonine-protein phosphatase PP1 isozyme 9 n=1 Tax=Paratrimastix pyriformis TaxID=342808 RepID=A0ABQ8UUX6_9EUKA|nr:putative Serine/threonine-protein phosphatase PP1 isozyme 9 [Paratrimastix pyriformis]